MTAPADGATRSSSPTATSPDRAALDAAWPGWADGVDARRRRRRRRPRSDRPRPAGSIAGSATATRSRRRTSTRWRRRRPDRPRARRQGRVRHGARAPRGDRRGRRRGSRSSARSAGARLDHALANVGAARPPGAGRPAGASSSTRGRRVRLVAHRAGDASRLRGPDRRPRLAHPVRRRRRRRHDRGAPLPARRRAAAGRPGARPLERPDVRRRAPSRVERGSALVIETPATLST